MKKFYFLSIHNLKFKTNKEWIYFTNLSIPFKTTIWFNLKCNDIIQKIIIILIREKVLPVNVILQYNYVELFFYLFVFNIPCTCEKARCAAGIVIN